MAARPSLLACSALVLGLALAHSAAASECAVETPSVQPDPVLTTYDPFHAADAQQRFTIEVRTISCPLQRNVFLELDVDPLDEAAAAGESLLLSGPGGRQLSVLLTDESGRSAHGRDEFFNVKPGLTTLQVRVPRGQVVPPGDYRARMIARTRLDNGNNRPETSDHFELIVRVGAAVGLLPVHGDRLELGELSTGDRADAAASFDAYANVPYRLSLVSDLGFVLRRGGTAGAAGPGYVPLLSGDTVPTAAPRRDFDRPSSSEWRRRHSLDVEVGNIAGLPAGSYRDTITVEISARLGD